MKIETVEAFHMTGKSHDCGSKLGDRKANVEYSLQHGELADDFKAYVQDIIKA
jgi:UTP--glucose-1-phosphate uridylyltransferase